MSVVVYQVRARGYKTENFIQFVLIFFRIVSSCWNNKANLSLINAANYTIIQFLWK